MHQIPSFGEGIPPKTIAIVGISSKRRDDLSGHAPGYDGYMLFRMFRESGFRGRIYPINPKASDIDGVKAYPNVTSVPEPLDLVIITVQAPVVPQVLEDCVTAKAFNVHICTSGFGETGEPEGELLENRLRDIAITGGLRVIGPNSMGLHIPSANMKMFQKVELKQGPVAFISQSGGNAEVFLFLGPLLQFGFSSVISYGNGLTLDAPDYLEYFATDPETRIICMYIEGIRDGNRFMELVREINSVKPVIILKGGLSSSGARAAASHTGAMAGDEKIWDAFFKQTGAIKVDSLEEMGEAVMTLLNINPITRTQVAVFGIGGGNTVMNGDICANEGVEVPALSPETIAGFSELVSLVNQGLANPMDAPSLIGDPSNLRKTLKLLSTDPVVDVAILALNRGFFSPSLYGDGMSRVSALVQGLKDFNQDFPAGKPIVVAISDQGYLSEAESCIRLLREGGITAYPSLPRACRALRRVASYHKFLKRNFASLE
ncbi:MAG: CoA-binding protein [Deltaproteobacteria bacterium]|nr:CoA-binding protein [Deltaproteobacteria bacterium]